MASESVASRHTALRGSARPHHLSRFIPLPNSSDAHGAWRRYYARYEEMTLQRIDPGLPDLVPELQLFVPRGLPSTSTPIPRGPGLTYRH